MTQKALVIRHVAFEDLGSFADEIEGAGLDIVYLDAASADLTQIDAEAVALLVVLGGPISANDVEDYPFIEPELDILRRRIAADLPTLGICLGAQLIVRAANASVYAGAGKEIGWYPLTLTEDGRSSALRHLCDGEDIMLHWHGETFDLPAGARLLASSALYRNQAFSLNNRVLGLQFHPEITAAGMEHWFVGHTGEIALTDGISVPLLRADTHRYAAGLESRGRAFLREWLAQVLD